MVAPSWHYLAHIQEFWTLAWLRRDQSEVACQQWKLGILCVPWMQMRTVSVSWLAASMHTHFLVSCKWLAGPLVTFPALPDLSYTYMSKTHFRNADTRVWGQYPLTVEICLCRVHVAVHIHSIEFIRGVWTWLLVGELKKKEIMHTHLINQKYLSQAYYEKGLCQGKGGGAGKESCKGDLFYIFLSEECAGMNSIVYVSSE